MAEDQWKWDGNYEDFIHLVQWALVCRKLAQEQTPGWLKEVTNFHGSLELADKNGFTEEAVVAAMKSISDGYQNWKANTRMTDTFELTFEALINKRLQGLFA